MIREPIVSGKFYPANNEKLNEIIKKFSPKETTKISAMGVLLPHAGYIYSGKVAVWTVSKINPKSRIIILGPNHTAQGKGFALWAKGKWKLPSGDIVIDQELGEKILKQDKYIEEDYLAHHFEHSIEVELPILSYFLKEFTFVPICCQVSTLDKYRKAAYQLSSALKEIKKDILFVVSTDMTHYENDADVRRKDRIAIEKIISLDDEGLLRVVDDEKISMCGIAPVAIFISCMKNLGAHKAQVVLYQTSGDTSGDYTSVVGYTGIIVN